MACQAGILVLVFCLLFLLCTYRKVTHTMQACSSGLYCLGYHLLALLYCTVFARGYCLGIFLFYTFHVQLICQNWHYNDVGGHFERAVAGSCRAQQQTWKERKIIYDHSQFFLLVLFLNPSHCVMLCVRHFVQHRGVKISFHIMTAKDKAS